MPNPFLSCPRAARVAALGATLLLLAGCGSFPGGLPLGSPVADLDRLATAPTAVHDLPGGGRRFEFAQGQYGRQTYMLDFDATGHLVGNEQVLTEAHFREIVPGMPGTDVRRRLGRPAHVFNVPRQRLQVWNYRFFEGDCVWFQISVSDTSGAVTEAAMGTDPACDVPNGRD